MLVVVRCPLCRGAARVAPDVVGMLVECPRCSGSFLAVEEAVVRPVPDDAPPRARREPREPRESREPRDRRDRRRRSDPEPAPPTAPDPFDPDPHPDHALPDHAGGLPVSVLIGLALLPFVIPLLWLVAPIVLGEAPELSVTSPVALAVAASALCLAVIYTVDWSPGTRVKGVFVVLALAYLTGVGLYVLRKHMVDRAREFVGAGWEWKEFRPPAGGYRVNLPGPAVSEEKQPLGGWTLKCYKADRRTRTGGHYSYLVGSGPDTKPGLGDAAWFDQARQQVVVGKLQPTERTVPPSDIPRREWLVNFGGPARLVQVCRKDGKVYYLAVEGPNLAYDDEPARPFFDSFQPDPAE